MKVDQETKELAALALRNAFWEEFSGLVNHYLAASGGLLKSGKQEDLLSTMTSVFGRDDEIHQYSGDLNIWVEKSGTTLTGAKPTCGFDMMLEALEYKEAESVHVFGKKVFERRNGEWFYLL